MPTLYVIKHKTKGFYMGGIKFSSEYPDAFFFNSGAQARLNAGRLIELGEAAADLEIIANYGLLDANFI